MNEKRTDLLIKLADSYKKLKIQQETIDTTKVALQRWIADRKETKQLIKELEEQLHED